MPMAIKKTPKPRLVKATQNRVDARRLSMPLWRFETGKTSRTIKVEAPSNCGETLTVKPTPDFLVTANSCDHATTGNHCERSTKAL
jgi:hypothetical protein